MNNLLYNIIARDLQIERFSDETMEEYGHRLIYSAVAAWVRVSLLGKSYADLEMKQQEDSVDIMHVGSWIESVAAALICSIPCRQSWLRKNEAENQEKYIARNIISNMIVCQEISRLKDQRRLTISPRRKLSFGKHTIILGGTKWQNEVNTLCSVGLGRWLPGLGENGNLVDFMGVPVLSAEVWLNELVRNAPRRNIEILDGWYVFQPSSSEIRNSDSWRIIDRTKLTPGISLGKNHTQDYGLIIKKDKNLRVIPLDQWFYKEKEIYRIMYALNVKAGKPSCFEAQDHGDYVIAHFHSGIPRAEEKLLLLSSWPYTHMGDRYNRVIPYVLWSELKRVFEQHMGIQWIVKQTDREKALMGG